MDDAVSDLVKDINKLRLELGDTRSKGESANEELLGKLSFMRRLVEELREKTWELDTNTRNNLVIYGIKEEGNPGNTEWAVKEARHQEFFSLGRKHFFATDDPELSAHLPGSSVQKVSPTSGA